MRTYELRYDWEMMLKCRPYQTDGDESKGSAPAGGAVDALAEQERRLLQRMNRPRRGLDGKIVGGGSAAGFSPL